jgi:hypothetical protein
MNITTLTPQQLRDAADLKERIDALENEMNELLGGEVPAPVQIAAEAPDKPRNGRRKKRRLSPEGRANIIAATKARWAARRGETQSEETPAAAPVKRKRRISRALREARSAAMKAMWAKARRAGKSSL